MFYFFSMRHIYVGTHELRILLGLFLWVIQQSKLKLFCEGWKCLLDTMYYIRKFANKRTCAFPKTFKIRRKVFLKYIQLSCLKISCRISKRSILFSNFKFQKITKCTVRFLTHTRKNFKLLYIAMKVLFVWYLNQHYWIILNLKKRWNKCNVLIWFESTVEWFEICILWEKANLLIPGFLTNSYLLDNLMFV